MAGAGGPRIWAAMVGDVLGVEIPPGRVVVGVWGLREESTAPGSRRQLRLNRRHDLELCPRPPGSGSEDGLSTQAISKGEHAVRAQPAAKFSESPGLPPGPQSRGERAHHVLIRAFDAG